MRANFFSPFPQSHGFDAHETRSEILSSNSRYFVSECVEVSVGTRTLLGCNPNGSTCPTHNPGYYF